MKRVCIFVFIMTASVSARGTDAPHTLPSHESTQTNNITNNPYHNMARHNHAPEPTTPISEPVISINTDSPLDMNWTGALTVSGAQHTPPTEQIILPFMRNHPINNLNIKVRVMDVRF